MIYLSSATIIAYCIILCRRLVNIHKYTLLQTFIFLYRIGFWVLMISTFFLFFYGALSLFNMSFLYIQNISDITISTLLLSMCNIKRMTNIYKFTCHKISLFYVGFKFASFFFIIKQNVNTNQ